MNVVSEVIEAIKTKNKIIIICGAGVSVSCGIPDFRSKGIGLYNTLDCAKIGLPSPELLFDAEFFNLDPAPFYRFARSLLPNENIQPSISHKFFALLEKRRKLIRLYSQNIDGLERTAGISKLLECHGSMSKFKCIKCRKITVLSEEMVRSIQSGLVCVCSICSNTLKPCITFFGENVPNNLEKCIEKDLKQDCDLVIVTGTSLEVKGSVCDLLRRLKEKSNVKSVLINKQLLHEKRAFKFDFDYTLLGNCDDIFLYISQQLQWPIPDYSTIDESKSSTTTMRSTQERTGDASPNSPYSSSPFLANGGKRDLDQCPLTSAVSLLPSLKKKKSQSKSVSVLQSKFQTSGTQTGVADEIVHGIMKELVHQDQDNEARMTIRALSTNVASIEYHR